MKKLHTTGVTIYSFNKYINNKFFLLVFVLLAAMDSFGQATFTPTGNSNYLGMDKNILYNAKARFTVSQTGTRSFNLEELFDGSHLVQYVAGFDGNAANNVVIEISGLPEYHTQLGAYVGFSTRYYPTTSFKIEGYDTYGGNNTWYTIADVTDKNNDPMFSTLMPAGMFTKLRFTFRKSPQLSGPEAGWIGLSELFFVNAEGAKAYDGLMVQYSPNGAVGIGTASPNPDYKLNVNGKIRAKEIKVETANWPDYVFEEGYQVGTLVELERYIKTNRHLPEMPTAKEVAANGLELGEMNRLLLKKVEELTLHLIEKDKQLQDSNKRLTSLEDESKTMKELLKIIQLKLLKP
jgi:hypothetical protein